MHSCKKKRIIIKADHSLRESLGKHNGRALAYEYNFRWCSAAETDTRPTKGYRSCIFPLHSSCRQTIRINETKDALYNITSTTQSTYFDHLEAIQWLKKLRSRSSYRAAVPCWRGWIWRDSHFKHKSLWSPSLCPWIRIWCIQDCINVGWLGEVGTMYFGDWERREVWLTLRFEIYSEKRDRTFCRAFSFREVSPSDHKVSEWSSGCQPFQSRRLMS